MDYKFSTMGFIFESTFIWCQFHGHDKQLNIIIYEILTVEMWCWQVKRRLTFWKGWSNTLALILTAFFCRVVDQHYSTFRSWHLTCGQLPFEFYSIINRWKFLTQNTCVRLLTYYPIIILHSLAQPTDTLAVLCSIWSCGHWFDHLLIKVSLNFLDYFEEA